MRAVLQRALSGSVSVSDTTISSIGPGLVALIGIGTTDTPKDIEYVVSKLLSLRLWDAEDGTPWKRSVKELGGEVLCVSQFTLFAKTSKGSKPDFHQAMPPDRASAMYDAFLKRMGEAYDPAKIKNGQFGAMMQVSLVNDGPVTITLDSRKWEYVGDGPGSASGASTPTGGFDEDKARAKREEKERKRREWSAQEGQGKKGAAQAEKVAETQAREEAGDA